MQTCLQPLLELLICESMTTLSLNTIMLLQLQMQMQMLETLIDQDSKYSLALLIRKGIMDIIHLDGISTRYILITFNT